MDVQPLSHVVDLVASRPARAGDTRVVAVDGPSGSGKTTLARRLAHLLDCQTIHMDDLYPGWDGLAEAPGLLVDQVLHPLSQAEPASYRRWDWHAHQWAESHPVAPEPVLLIEGVGSAALRCAPYLSLIVWIEAPREERMRRGLERDGETYRPHWERWARQEQELFAADHTRERADLVVDGFPSVAHDPDTQVVLTS
ncbi:AAA family ATPase [Aeromicrobium sp. CTD01-1L150]|uniref:AAA family ATPase n=1 Tax=Aeromicrobium sp. CTD01-1L150 TaxID=3341830 RepID=UPI0035BF67BA